MITGNLSVITGYLRVISMGWETFYKDWSLSPNDLFWYWIPMDSHRYTQDGDGYPLIMLQFANWKMAIEIVSFPIKNGWIFQFVMWKVYQRLWGFPYQCPIFLCRSFLPKKRTPNPFFQFVEGWTPRSNESTTFSLGSTNIFFYRHQWDFMNLMDVPSKKQL